MRELIGKPAVETRAAAAARNEQFLPLGFGIHFRFENGILTTDVLLRWRGNFATSLRRRCSTKHPRKCGCDASIKPVRRGWTRVLPFWLSLGQLHCPVITLNDRIQRNRELRPGSGPVKLGGESLELQIRIGAVFKVAIDPDQQ